ncbi:hypothetical protein BJ322DRAFT_1088797 [Thelephora terrestris]|uniref:F-box domain-containing protein n=1 Tax=Thelephora terrestris TaxID=56493 RepID=A0A9P6H4M6_9AGAM|nr:hypothetical protein BJ322DRAFT_1088797 [Thelephora terrestris]
MPALSGYGLESVETIGEPAHRHAARLPRWKNLITSPLFRLPTELILKIYLHTVDDDDLQWLALTAICHQLREIFISSPRLWGAVDFRSVSLTKLFLERCNFDPHLISVTDSSFASSTDVEREALWKELECRTLTNLHFLVFVGSKKEFNRRVVHLVRRAPNLASLELDTYSREAWEFELPLGDQIPHLSMLGLGDLQISWCSPLLRNLTRLELGCTWIRTPRDSFTPIETFLTALANCPDLERLCLNLAGPTLPEGDRDDCEVVVRLRHLKDLVLKFRDHKVVGYILSHIWYPQSTKVMVEASYDVDLSVALSQVIPRPGTETLQNLRSTKTVTINMSTTYDLTTDNFRFSLRPPNHVDVENPENLRRFASRIVEILGRETVINLDVRFGLFFELPFEMWRELLHGFHRLERISYVGCLSTPTTFVDPFCWALCEPFEEGPVCPRLWDLRIPSGFAHGLSAAVLKSALATRSGSGKRLKRISLTSCLKEDETIVLGSFSDVVDEVSRPPDPRPWFISFIKNRHFRSIFYPRATV